MRARSCRWPFSPERKKMVTIINNPQRSEWRLLCKVRSSFVSLVNFFQLFSKTMQFHHTAHSPLSQNPSLRAAPARSASPLF